jgi:hypothetical protein
MKIMKHLFFIAVVMLSVTFAFTACSGNATGAATEQLAQDETYTCSMHPEVMGDHAGECPKCDMKLVKQKMTPEQQKIKNEGAVVKPKE